MFSLIKYTPLTYNKKYTYPWWGDALGWLLALSSMICIPAWSIYKLRTLKGPLREVGGKQWGMGTSLDSRWVASDGNLSTKGLNQPGVGTSNPEDVYLGVFKRDTG